MLSALHHQHMFYETTTYSVHVLPIMFRLLDYHHSSTHYTYHKSYFVFCLHFFVGYRPTVTLSSVPLPLGKFFLPLHFFFILTAAVNVLSVRYIRTLG